MSTRPWSYRILPRLRPLVLGVWLAGIATVASAGESRIELRDGTVLHGELVSAGGGVYRIRSPSLGEIQVRESDVVSLRPMGPEGANPSAAPTESAGTGDRQGELAAIQQRLVGDPDTLKAIMSLQDDPQIRAALADPGFAQLILSGNVAALRSDPRFQKLMEHPGIKGILGRVQGP
jgi:hypothetical protein